MNDGAFRVFLVKENLPLWSQQLPDMPTLIYEVLRETKHKQEVQRFTQQDEKVSVNLSKTKILYFLSGIILTVATGIIAIYLHLF
jgi:hypothetical protein